MEFKDKIKARRLELGMTLDDVAKLVGVSNPTISRWESGAIVNQRRDKIELLAKALQISPGELMGWDSDDGNPEDSAPFPTRYTHVKIAGRDGTLVEKDLTDADAELLLKMIERLPDAGEDL